MRAQKWEYTSVVLQVGGWVGPKIDREAMDAELNRYGDAGWELVSALDLSDTSGKSSGIVALFKRPRGG
jgi:hypothetical protein